MIRAIALFCAALFITANANAQEFQGEFKDWGLFTTKENGNKVCYITSNPTNKTGNYRHRGNPYLLVTYRGAGTAPEVSVDVGFPFKNGSEVDFTIDGRKSFKFFTSPQTQQMAWAKDSNADRTVVESLKRGGRVVTKGTSTRGTYAQDTYSLKGFSAAYNKMLSLCQ